MTAPASGPVSYEVEDGIAVVTIDNPPVNALGHAVRSGLAAAMDRVTEDPDARAAVVVGRGRLFIGGADISEFGRPPVAPTLPEVIARIEATPKPVIAAIQGAALGGGLEVALGCHYRVVLPGARLGLPEVTLGIIPGAGGTQRLPRLIGLAATLEMVPAGGSVDAARAVEIGLADRMGEGDARAAGVAFARGVLAQGLGPRPISAMPPPDPDPDAIAAARSLWQKKAPGEVARLAAIDAVEAASRLGLAAGLAEERRIFLQMMATPQRAALIHAFFAERQVSKLPELADVAPRPVACLGVVGGGTMGAGIATAALLRGFSVVLAERDVDAADRARATIAANLDGAVARGKLTGAVRDACLADALRCVADHAPLAEADLIVEAVFEDMDTKQAVFAALDAVARPGAVLATNTSYLDVNRIARATGRPADVVGLHFFSPAHVMKLVEVVVPEKAAPEAVATAFDVAKRLGKIAVRAGVCDGFIGNRIMSAYRAAADRMVLAGASPYEVDRAVREFGGPMGPHEMADLAGLDIGQASRQRRTAAGDLRQMDVPWADALCAQGRLGRKTGRGFYLYPDGARQGREDPDLAPLIDAARAAHGVTPQPMASDEIRRRYMAALVNEAARVLGEGIARRPRDIDVVFLHGYGFPRWRGGPMHWADAEGLPGLLADIERYAEADPVFWEPAPLLRRLVADGGTFGALNEADGEGPR